MSQQPITSQPRQRSYDVVIVGGAMIGSSVAWYLTNNPDFDGSILVVEKDPTYQFSSTAHTNSCMRQQFSNEINVRISQYAAEMAKNFRARLGGDPEIPDITLQAYGYMYLADNEDFAGILRENQKVQATCGAATRIMTPDEITEAYPFYNLDGTILGSHNPVDEGYFDGATMFDWWKRKARANGAEYLTNEIMAIARTGGRVDSVTLKSGEIIGAGAVINCSGPRAAVTARMAGLDVPVEPRRRYTFIFDAATPLNQDLPLTIDPSGVHVRTDGRYYLCGCPPHEDPAATFDDFEMDHGIWEKNSGPPLQPAFRPLRRSR